MKFRSFIWLSAAALVILVLVQYYFISETFRTKQQQFDSKYSSLAKLGIYNFENRFIDEAEDSILNVLDDFSYFAMHDLGFAGTEEQKDSILGLITSEFKYQLNRSGARAFYLKSYLKDQQENTPFVSENIIKKISLLNFGDEIPVFADTGQIDHEIVHSGYSVNSYTIERNYFRVNYELYVSFPGRAEKISREMLLTKILSITTLLIVFGIFFLTLRNLLIQKRLSEMKTDFINNMTHELKTPLSTISVASSTLAKNDGKLLPDRITELSGIIKKQNRHLTRLIDRILDISIWEKDQVKIDPKTTQLEPFIKDIVDDFKTSRPEARITLEFENETNNYHWLDPVHFTTVINNLLSNACKYGGSPPHINIYVDPRNPLIIKVKDNGHGIPADEKKQVFEKFFRGKESRRNAVRGLGLGLYYVRKIIEAHGGEVTIESSSPSGTVFKIEIPDQDEHITG